MEPKEWVKSLKPGDIVIRQFISSVTVQTVKKITPSGIIRTDGGSYKLGPLDSCVSSYGKSLGHLRPATPKLLAEAERQKAEKQETEQRRIIINKAKGEATKLSIGTREMTYELAVALLKLLEVSE